MFSDEEREDFVRCVSFGYQDGRPDKSWCGCSDRPFFVDAAHASLNGLHKGRLIACPECVNEITKALKNGHFEE